MAQRRWIVVALLSLAAAALVAHSLVFNFVTDDAFISFVYSRNLVEHGQLVFNLGERVEGYTNFLWTILMAALLKLGLLPEVTSRVLGTAFGVATLGTCAWLSRKIRGEQNWSAWDALPALFLAGVPGYACWSSGGLETQLFTFCFTLGAAFYLTDEELRVRSAVALGLAALTRPEGVLFFALTGLHHLIARRRIGRAEFTWAGVFLLLVVPHFLFRRWYYGWWLPNTFYIKASGGRGTWDQGGYYLGRVISDFHLWAFAAAALGALLGVRARKLAGYSLLVIVVFCLYVASVGGDFMGLYRFFLPVVPLLLVVGVAGLRAVVSRSDVAIQVAIVVALLAGHGWHAFRVTRHAVHFIGADRGIDTPGYLRWYTADRAAIGKWFAPRARPDDFAAVGGAGAQVYFSRIPSLDCFGLSDSYIAHKLAATSSRPGHQKYAPDDYILSRRPTIITSHNYNIGGAPNSCSDAGSWKARGYRCVSARVAGLSSPYYSFLLRNDRRMDGLVDEVEP